MTPRPWVALAGALAMGGCTQPGPVTTTSQPMRVDPAPVATGAPVPVTAESPLATRLAQASARFDGAVGIAVRPIGGTATLSQGGGRAFPQQSVSKLWVAIAALDAVDRGRVALADPVTLTRDDLTLFHQPIRDEVLAAGTLTTTLGDLLERAITQSDNSANDRLLRAIGGPAAVRAMLAAKGIEGVRFFDGERALQAKTAGLVWQPAYALGRGFEEARAALPMAVRQAAFDRYVAEPDDGASAEAIVAALDRLARGELLSPGSTRLLLDTMGRTRTGGLRIKAGLPAGWRWSHKTGTGQTLGSRTAGINDVGILTAPDGTAWAVAVMTMPNVADDSPQQLMQKVARALVEAHGAGRP